MTRKKIKVKSDEDGSLEDSSCLMVVLMTHGAENGMVAASDIDYPVNIIWKFFTPNQCPALAGKPKMFIILVICFRKHFLKNQIK